MRTKKEQKGRERAQAGPGGLYRLNCTHTTALRGFRPGARRAVVCCTTSGASIRGRCGRGSEVDAAALALPVPVPGGLGALRSAGLGNVPGFRLLFFLRRRGRCIDAGGGPGRFTGRLSGFVVSGHFPLTTAHPWDSHGTRRTVFQHPAGSARDFFRRRRPARLPGRLSLGSPASGG